jgi:DNA-binding NtrC family response regulator
LRGPPRTSFIPSAAGRTSDRDMTSSTHAGTLLIVDDREDIRRSMHRYFAAYFEAVYLAGDPHEAELLLRKHRPTYLLCDFWLGDEYLPATEYIPHWRKQVPTLRRVALMTGTNLAALGSVASVDAVFQKPFEPVAVLKFFLDQSLLERPPDSTSRDDR